MSRRRSDNNWRTALRDSRKVPSDQPIRELVKFLAKRAAEKDFESLLMRQRKKKLKDIRKRDKR
jgi:hypothetical protein